MAGVTKECSVEQAYNFKPESSERLGHLTALTLGGAPVTADQELTVPGSGAKEKVIGPLTGVVWEGGHAAPVEVTFRVSTKNHQEIASIVQQKLQKNSSAEFKFCVYEYDPLQKAWFKAFFANENLQTNVKKESGNIVYTPPTAVADDITSPKNYEYMFTFECSETAQGLHSAIKKGGPTVLTWGTTVTSS